LQKLVIYAEIVYETIGQNVLENIDRAEELLFCLEEVLRTTICCKNSGREGLSETISKAIHDREFYHEV